MSYGVSAISVCLHLKKTLSEKAMRDQSAIQKNSRPHHILKGEVNGADKPVFFDEIYIENVHFYDFPDSVSYTRRIILRIFGYK